MTEKIVIIGGGIVGIALARELSLRGLAQVTVVEKEQELATHQTGHNSGVVHAGIYYAPGSLKASLCAIGRVKLREFCQDKAIDYQEVGKLVVAVEEAELAALDELERRSLANTVPGLRRVEGTELKEIEPHVAGIAGLHSPHTAVVDYRDITVEMANDVKLHGGTVLLGEEVRRIVVEGSRVRVVTAASEHLADRVIACAGLQSDVVARMVGASPSPKILPFRGEYWSLAEHRRDLVRGMIYPVPDPRFPFLGVHFTRGIHGDVHVGPNAVPALAREGYTWGRISVRDTLASLAWPGALPLARKHWRVGVREVIGSLSKRNYYAQARRFVPELQISDLAAKTAAGVRAQAWGRDGSLLDDFAVDRVGPVILVRNAPSPAATSSMAIAEYLVQNFILDPQ